MDLNRKLITQKQAFIGLAVVIAGLMGSFGLVLSGWKDLHQSK